MNHDLDLYASEDLVLEELPQGNALGCFSSVTSASSASCPSSAATLTTASTAS